MKIVKIVLSILITYSFVACSNMTIGLEEDSRFYNGPMYDNREDVVSQDTTSAKEEISNKEPVVEKKVETETSKELAEVKTPAKVAKPTRVEKPSEEETTFTYERDDE